LPSNSPVGCLKNRWAPPPAVFVIGTLARLPPLSL